MLSASGIMWAAREEACCFVMALFRNSLAAPRPGG